VLVHEETVSVANAKQIMMRIIDGDERSPSVIAAEFGLTGKVELSQELL
jgi:Asp-tRNA(Asn)/Glu-tRNA(Gln) amidotransferase B subunit